MPPEAFKDLWDTVDAGHTWTGLVKNRAKNGDYYWVRANVTPVPLENGEVEYMSVRTEPTAEEKKFAERPVRQGKRSAQAKIPRRWTAASCWSLERLVSAGSPVGGASRWRLLTAPVWTGGAAVILGLVVLALIVAGAIGFAYLAQMHVVSSRCATRHRSLVSSLPVNTSTGPRLPSAALSARSCSRSGPPRSSSVSKSPMHSDGLMKRPVCRRL